MLHTHIGVGKATFPAQQQGMKMCGLESVREWSLRRGEAYKGGWEKDVSRSSAAKEQQVF